MIGPDFHYFMLQDWKSLQSGEPNLNNRAKIHHDQDDRALYNRGRDEIYRSLTAAFRSQA